MIPVLATQDPFAASELLVQKFGFTTIGPGRLDFGTASVAVISSNDLPANLVALQLDHVAFAVADADVAYQRFAALGAELDLRFTPAGPRNIPQFWDHGVRFVFFQGPQAAPFEFCAKNRAGTVAQGHSHFAIRTSDLDTTEADLVAKGAHRIAQYLLPGVPRPVAVRFLQLGPVVFELFDEAPVVALPARLGWVGLLPDGA